MQLRFLITIPIYNHATTVKKVIQDCLEKTNFSVLVVDDGSDLSVEKQVQDLKHKDRLFFLTHAKNQGKGKALQSAMKWAVKYNYTHLLTLDADDQHPISEVQLLIQAAYKNPWDLIIGDRLMQTEHVPASSQFGKKFSNFWVWIETGINVGDSQSGFRIYPLFGFQRISFLSKRYDFEIEAIVRFLWQGGNVQSVPVVVKYFAGSERVTHFHKFNDNLRLTLLNTLLVTQSFWKRPKLFFLRRSARKSKKIAVVSKDGIGIYFMRWVLKSIGLKAAYFCLWFIVPYYYLFSFQARKASMEYWKIINPRSNLVTRQLFYLRQLYVFAKTLVDRAYHKSTPVSPFNFTWATGKNEISFDSEGAPKGTVLLLCHAGGWELAISRFSQKNYSKEFTAVMFHQKNDFKHSSSEEYSSKTSVAYFNQQTGTVMQLRDKLLCGQVVGMMSDRPVGRSYELVNFLGYLCIMDSSAIRLALQTKSEMYSLFCAKISANQYEIEFSNLQLEEILTTESNIEISNEETIQRTLAIYSKNLEQWLKRYPEQWFNFVPFWSGKIL